MKDSANILLGIFCREPIQGKVKTRLARTVGEAKALEIYKKLLSETIQTAKEVDCPILLFVTDPLTTEAPILWTESLPAEIQCEGDLGQRMSKVFEQFCDGEKKVILIGSDCPGLKSAHLVTAINHLNHSEIVIGPASDGGYYLIGMRKHHPELFENIEWSSAAVLTQTIEKAKSVYAEVYLLPVLIDIDTEEDLIRTKFLESL